MFHLAIPAADLQESEEFYRMLGAEMGREYPDSIIMYLFGAQVVLHKSNDFQEIPTMYPRHLGKIFDSENTFNREWVKHIGKPYVFVPYFVRHKNKSEEHVTFFLKDPSNNLIEFKWYKNQNMI